MPKPLIQDVMPPQKKTIRDIPIPDSRRPRGSFEAKLNMPSYSDSVQNEENEVSPAPRLRRSFRFPLFPKIPKIGLYVVGALFFGGLIFLGIQIFNVSATVTVTPQVKEINVDGSFSAKKDAQKGELQFEIMTVTKESTKTVPATGEKNVETKASGTIVLYNDYSSQPQRLIKNTRFETPEGLIYRINNSVTIPGKKVVAGKSVPGSVEALVYADVAGDKYNIGLTDFTIPGFKGDPRFDKFYARSKTAMTGGNIGVVKTALPSDIAAASQALDQSLRTDLLKEAASQVPPGYVLYDSAVYVETATLSPAESSDVKKSGTLYGVIFDKKKLSSFLANRLISGYDGSEVELSSVDTLVFSPQALDTKPWQNGAITFALKGKSSLTWLFNEENLKQDLAGQMKAQVPTVLKAYPAISRAEVSVSPFWRGNLPDSPSQIKVVVQKTATVAN